MRPGPLDVYFSADEKGRKTKMQRERAEKLGLALMLDKAGKRPPAFYHNYLLPAIALDQVRFFFNDNGQVVGYMIWANLSEECAEQVRRKPRSALHISELNEGDQAWILDVFAPKGHLGSIRKLLQRERFFGDRTVHYSRLVRGRLVHVQMQSAVLAVPTN